LYWMMTLHDGTTIRLDAAGNRAAATISDVAEAARRLAGEQAIAEQGLLDGEDAYHFKQRGKTFVLPVYRVILADGSRYYLDPRSGALLRRADAAEQWHRWLFGALHRIDFSARIRTRPLWDIVVLILMLGGLGLSTTGAVLAIRRICGDGARLLRL